jgi:transposase
MATQQRSRIADSFPHRETIPLADLHSLWGRRGETTTADLGIKPFGIGVDCHSRFVQVCLYLPAFQTGAVRRFERQWGTDFASLRQAKAVLLRTLAAAGFPADAFPYPLESTGCYHQPVILAWGGQPSIVNPVLAGQGKRKTDRLDARALAYLALTGKWPVSYFPPLAVQELRVYARARRSANRNGNRFINAIGTILLSWGYTFGSRGSLASSAVRPVLEDLIEGRPVSAHPAFVAWDSGVPVPPGICDLMRRHLQSHDAARAEARRLEALIRDGIRALDWSTGDEPANGKALLDILQTIPGVGGQTAMTWLLEVGDLTRFPTAKAVQAYAGFDPTLRVSAGKVTQHAMRKGNKVLHQAFIQAAQSVLRRSDTPLGWWGQQLVKKRARGGWQRAVGAIGRRLVAACYYCHYRREPYQDTSYLLGLRDSEGPCPGKNETAGEEPRPKEKSRASRTRPTPPPAEPKPRPRPKRVCSSKES